MESNSNFKISRKLVIKVFVFLCLLVFMILWTRHTTEELSLEWKESNNINPIKCAVSGEIDSIRMVGRGIFIRLDNGEKFIIQPTILKGNKKEFGIPTIFSLINIGDSLIKESNSTMVEIKKRASNETIVLVLDRMNYGNLTCIPDPYPDSDTLKDYKIKTTKYRNENETSYPIK